MLGAYWDSSGDWQYEPRLGFRLLGSNELYVYARFKDESGKLSDWGLYFWDWSQHGPDSCYGSGKWMPVTDQSVIDSFPCEWKQEIESR